MKDCFLKFDFLSVKPSININSNVRIRTCIGATFSLISFILVMSMSIYLANVGLKRDKMTILYKENPVPFPSYDFFNKTIAFCGHNNYGIQFKEQDRIFNFVAKYRYFDKETITMKEFYPKIDPNCEINSKRYWPETYKEIPWKNYQCIDITDPQIKGKNIYNNYGDTKNGFSMLNLYVNKCVNDTSRNITNCLPQEEIDKYLDDYYVSLNMEDYTINNDNIETPGELSYFTRTLRLSINLFRRIFVRIREIEYKTDYGRLFEDFKTENYSEIENFEYYIDTKSPGHIPGNFAYFTFINSSTKEYYKRTFVKFQELIAYLGGLMESILFVSNTIVKYFSKITYNIKLSRFILDFDKLESVKLHGKGNPHTIIGLEKHINPVNIHNINSVNKADGELSVQALRNFRYVKTNKSISALNINSSNVNNSNLNERKHKESIRIIKKKNENNGLKKFKLKFNEYLCLKFLKSPSTKFYKFIKNYVNKKTSIDEILMKLMDIDKLKFVTMNDNSIDSMKLLRSPAVSQVYENHKSTRLQELWAKYEFNNDSNENYLLDQLNKDDLCEDEKKIIDLIKPRLSV